MKFWQVDSFTDKIFSGNPAAVFVYQEHMSNELMQNIAMEMNLSETAFVKLMDDKIELRWFTPNTEVDICGHATLAAAHVLFTEGFCSSGRISFETKSGILGVIRNGDSYTLDFPKQEASERKEKLEFIKSIFGISPLYVGSNGGDFVVVIEDVSKLKEVTPDFNKIKELSERGLLLTAKDDSGEYDYIYRGFFPKLDVLEDPVTGSANTLLAPYWAKELGQDNLRAYQASSRGGELNLKLSGDRVLISGNAKTTVIGELLI